MLAHVLKGPTTIPRDLPTQGPFNHEERQRVGLWRELYDMDLWPSSEREELKGASKRGSYTVVMPLPAATIRCAGQLERLRSRLGQILEMESANTGIISPVLPRVF